MKRKSSTSGPRRTESEVFDAVLAKALKPPKLSRDFRARLDEALATAEANEASRKRYWGEVRRLVAMSAVAGIAVVAVALGLLVPRPWGWLTAPAAQTTSEILVSTRVGERRSVKVPDGSGSVITLNTNSVMRWRKAGENYDVAVLKGEVLFDMHPNPRRHLVVTLRELTIVDTATMFAVQLSEDGALRVTVQEGQVQLSEPHRLPTVLSQDEQIVLGGADHSIEAARQRISPQQVDQLLSWRRGVLELECSSVGNAVRQINRYNVTEIQLADAHLDRLPVAGVFPVDDPRAFVHALIAAYPNLELKESTAANGTSVLELRRRPGAGVESRKTESGCNANR